MRLGTKILVLTLALVVTLTAAVVLIVRERVRAQELARVPAEIHRAVAAYFARVDAAAENTQRVARLLFGDPSTRSDLKNLTPASSIGEGDRAALQFRDYLFSRVMPKELAVTLLDGSRIEPSFHVLFNEEGELLLAVAPGDAALESAVADARMKWDALGIIDAKPGAGSRGGVRYLRADGRLFIALGVPVAAMTQEDGPPTNAYFVGYAINDAWAAGFIPMEGSASAPLSVWLVESEGNLGAVGGEGRIIGDRIKSESMIRGQGDGEFPIDGTPRAARLRGSFETFLAEVSVFPLLGGGPNETLVLAVTASLDRALDPMNRLLRTIALVGVGAVVLAFVACRFIASRIARPVKALVSSAEEIGAGRFDVHLDTGRKDEIGDLARGFEHMARGLAQRDFIKDTFGKFVDPSVVAGLIADPQRLRPGGEQRVQTVLMSDIAGFTALSERLRPEQVVELLNAYLGAAADIVAGERGVVDKFIGDAVVAFWGPPLTEDHSVRAARAALRMVEAAGVMKDRCAAMGVPALRVRIGIATGEVLVGNIGSASKFNYTVMGDTVNLCARLEGLNKVYGTAVLCEGNGAAGMGGEILVREIDVVRVVGRSAPTRVFEVMREGVNDAGAVERCRAFAEARGMMLAGDFVGASAGFEALAGREGDRGAAAAMARRCAGFVVSPPGAGWDGVFEADRK